MICRKITSPIRPLLRVSIAAKVARRAYYGSVHEESLKNPDQFWRTAAKEIDWIDPNPNGPIQSLGSGQKVEFTRWFPGRKLNMAYNCLTRHLPARGKQVAIAYDSPVTGTNKIITYNDLHTQVSEFAEGLKQLGVTKGDRVLIYMPNIPEAAVAMLSCAMIGAIHSVVFGGFAPSELATRIKDCNPKVSRCAIIYAWEACLWYVFVLCVCL
jgi:propionyl-CoA synthetase